MRRRLLAPVRRVATKRWWQSRTVWINAGAGAVLLLQAVAENVLLLQPLIPARWWPAVLAAITIVNVWLRLSTTAPIARQADCAVEVRVPAALATRPAAGAAARTDAQADVLADTEQDCEGGR